MNTQTPKLYLLSEQDFDPVVTTLPTRPSSALEDYKGLSASPESHKHTAAAQQQQL